MDIFRFDFYRRLYKSLRKPVETLHQNGGAEGISPRKAAFQCAMTAVVLLGLGLWIAHEATLRWLSQHPPSWQFWETFLKGKGLQPVETRIVYGRNLPTLTPDEGQLFVHRDVEGKIFAVLGFHPVSGARVWSILTGEKWVAPKDWESHANDWRTVSKLAIEGTSTVRLHKTKAIKPSFDPFALRY